MLFIINNKFIHTYVQTQMQCRVPKGGKVKVNTVLFLSKSSSHKVFLSSKTTRQERQWWDWACWTVANCTGMKNGTIFTCIKYPHSFYTALSIYFVCNLLYFMKEKVRQCIFPPLYGSFRLYGGGVRCARPTRCRRCFEEKNTKKTCVFLPLLIKVFCLSCQSANPF